MKIISRYFDLSGLTEHKPPDELEKIDYNDEIAVRNTLLKYEQIIADEQWAHCQDHKSIEL